jgi:hypothetical protein
MVNRSVHQQVTATERSTASTTTGTPRFVDQVIGRPVQHLCLAIGRAQRAELAIPLAADKRNVPTVHIEPTRLRQPPGCQGRRQRALAGDQLASLRNGTELAQRDRTVKHSHLMGSKLQFVRSPSTRTPSPSGAVGPHGHTPTVQPSVAANSASVRRSDDNQAGGRAAAQLRSLNTADGGPTRHGVADCNSLAERPSCRRGAETVEVAKRLLRKNCGISGVLYYSDAQHHG